MQIESVVYIYVTSRSVIDLKSGGWFEFRRVYNEKGRSHRPR